MRWAEYVVRCCWQSPAGWCGSAAARWIWGCWINVNSSCRWAPISGCSALSASVCWQRLSRYGWVRRRTPTPALAAALFSTVVMKSGCWAFSRYLCLAAMRRCGGRGAVD
ncbi:hypothetical protein KCP69_08600 [Salmonella enterica subsp. enterica]|nr:hypothetical protein KCP69_08600 [Salmonella enterica subsp. enterica]